MLLQWVLCYRWLWYLETESPETASKGCLSERLAFSEKNLFIVEERWKEKNKIFILRHLRMNNWYTKQNFTVKRPCDFSFKVPWAPSCWRGLFHSVLLGQVSVWQNQPSEIRAETCMKTQHKISHFCLLTWWFRCQIGRLSPQTESYRGSTRFMKAEGRTCFLFSQRLKADEVSCSRPRSQL